MRGEQCYDAGGVPMTCAYMQRGPFDSLEESFHVDLALYEPQPGPQPTALKEGTAPVTAYKSGAEAILL